MFIENGDQSYAMAGTDVFSVFDLEFRTPLFAIFK
jgi:hypothetical protein